MRRHTRCALFLSFALAPALASAVQLQPGVWEVSAHNMQVGGQAMPGMDQILAQMKNLPPEQRQMMEGMMAERGVKLGAGGVQICLTEEQIKAQDIPLQDPNSVVTSRSPNAAATCGNSVSPARRLRVKGRHVSSATRNSPPRSKVPTKVSQAAWRVRRVGSGRIVRRLNKTDIDLQM